MVFQFDSAPLSPGRQVHPYLASLLTENQQACCLNLHLNVPFGQKKKKKNHSFRFVEFGCFIFGHSASLSCCFTFLWNSLSVALSANFLCIASFCEQMGDSLSSAKSVHPSQCWNLKHLWGLPHTEILSLEDCVLKTGLSLTLLNQSILHL